MSAGKKQTEPNIRLIRPYTFDECTFDFTEPRTSRPVALFGAVEIEQNNAETIRLSGAFSSATMYHTTLAENVALAAASAPKEIPRHIVTEQVGAKDAVLVAEKEPICAEFVEQLRLGTFLLHAQHGHIYLNFTEPIALSATLQPPLQTRLVESVGFTQKEQDSPRTLPVERIAAKAAQTYEISHVLSDGAGLRDVRGHVFTAHRSFAEGLTLKARTERELELRRMFTEQIGLRIDRLRPPTSHFVEGIGVLVDRIPPLGSQFVERIGLSVSLVPPLVSRFTERVVLYDVVQRASEASLSGIAIGNGMTLAEFKSRLMRPVGYETFRPFHVGEYEYEKALVRIFITVGSFGAIPEIYDVVMNVDIDDTVDRGAARLAAKETVVAYNKHYYTKPEVTVTLLSGNTADGIVLPEITTIGTEAFTCVLRKRDGSAAAGTISWTSVGY